MSPEADPLQAVAGLTASDLHAILDLLSSSDISELDVTFGSARLSLRRAPSALVVKRADGIVEPLSLAIASPLVGIFHPSVKTGDAVTAGQSIGAVESFGMPTNIDAPQSGTVEDVLVTDGSPVEFGQTLLVLRRSPAA